MPLSPLALVNSTFATVHVDGLSLQDSRRDVNSAYSMFLVTSNASAARGTRDTAEAMSSLRLSTPATLLPLRYPLNESRGSANKRA
eukprot:CAMPEP_0119315618 /NCGR_PEP_ID=MMETSP1333-20130426/36580_1 /TAXON_ID=418940 /ORGANISM="Scyphosphaera apsteinii, Strain RCC1455" /LENGTH=85 /DNA_ID=CAMNT_0007321043 /DNA_START=592 /DNA_END=849 /DNA_ORIENTATION=+